jgi:hypothetical protein
MKHLRLELQKPEERIAPCGCNCGGTGGSHHSGGSHGSKGGSHKSGGSHGSKAGSHGTKG